MKIKSLFILTVITCTVANTAAYARYYDSVNGRFLSPDSVVQNAADPQSLNRYSYVRNNPLIYTDPDGHIVWMAIVAAAAIMGGTHGHPFDSSSWENFDWKTAIVSGVAAGAGNWAYGFAGAGFGGSIIGGAVGGFTGGGLNASLNGGNVMDGAGQGFAGGMISGVVSGGVAQIPIHTGNTGLLQTPLPNMAGSYVATRALGGSNGDAKASARYSFVQGVLANAMGLAYDKATGFKNGPTSQSASQDKAFLMSRPLNIPVIGTALAIAGIGHLAITNGQTSKELLQPRGSFPHQNGEVDLYPTDLQNDSYHVFGNRFGTTYQPLTTAYSEFQVPSTTIDYNFIFNNSNTAIYGMSGVR